MIFFKKMSDICYNNIKEKHVYLLNNEEIYITNKHIGKVYCLYNKEEIEERIVYYFIKNNNKLYKCQITDYFCYASRNYSRHK